MKRSYFVRAALTGVVLWSNNAGAYPTAWPEGSWDLQGVFNNTTSTLLADSDDPTTVWVLPPNAGFSQGAKLTALSANMGFCEEMASLQGYGRQMSQRMAEIGLEASREDENLKQKRATLELAREELAQATVGNSVISEISGIQSQIEDLNAEISKLQKELLECDWVTSRPACQTYQATLRERENERRNLNRELAVLRRQHRNEYRTYEKAKAKVDAAESAYDEVQERYARLEENLDQTRTSLINLYKHLGELEGGFAEINYDSGWDSNIEALRNQNAAYYQFKKIPTSHAVVYAAFPTGDETKYLNGLPMILSYTANGRSLDPSSVDETQREMTAFPSRMQATLRLSLVGACPLNDPQSFGVSVNQEGLPVLGLSASYEYPTAFRTRVKFKFNLYKFSEVIKEQGTKRGFFSSRSWSKLTENQLTRDTFEVAWEETDPDNLVPEEEKREIEAQVKGELIARILKSVGTPQFGGAIGASLPGPSGAILVARGLQKSCGWYSLACAAGSWFLRSFGSTEVNERFRSRFDYLATETWDRTMVRNKPAITIFMRKEATNDSY